MKEGLIDPKWQSLIAQGQKSPYFAELWTKVWLACQNLGFKDQAIAWVTLEKLWLPTAVKLATASQKLERTLIQGILGGQGTGKTTLCLILELILQNYGFTVASLSLDDLYLTYQERQTLQQQDPRLIWRGPPGTHDINLGLAVIDACLTGDLQTEILLPRFDKSAYHGAGERTTPQAIPQPDILLFEGWFVGVQPIDENCFISPPAPIQTPEAVQFAKDSNQRLNAYLPLWKKLDSLIVLYPEDYRFSKQWRKEAEQKMIASGKTGMKDPEIDRFVEYFWQSLHPELFIKPLAEKADLAVEIKGDRSLGKITGGLPYSSTTN